MPVVSYRRGTTGLEYRPRRQPLLNSPGRLAQAYGSVSRSSRFLGIPIARVAPSLSISGDKLFTGCWANSGMSEPERRPVDRLAGGRWRERDRLAVAGE